MRIDHLRNSSPKSLERVKQITGKDAKFYEGDILDRTLLQKSFAENEISSVIHFVWLKAVWKSLQKPTAIRKRTNHNWHPCINSRKGKAVFGTLCLGAVDSVCSRLFNLAIRN